MPNLGLIEAGENTTDAVERIHKAEVKKEIAEKKMLRNLKKMYPYRKMEKFGSYWIMSPED